MVGPPDNSTKKYEGRSVYAHQNLKDKLGAPELKDVLSKKKRIESTLKWLRHLKNKALTDKRWMYAKKNATQMYNVLTIKDGCTQKKVALMYNVLMNKMDVRRKLLRKCTMNR